MTHQIGPHWEALGLVRRQRDNLNDSLLIPENQEIIWRMNTDFRAVASRACLFYLCMWHIISFHPNKSYHYP